jgi:indolepyruvate decarboxylase
MTMYDASLGLFSGIDLRVDKGNAFSELIWGSIGWTSGASVGVAVAHRDKRVIVFTGDGGFQNCSTGPSTAARDKLNPIYFIFQNNTYAIDQFLVNPTSIPKDEIPDYNRLQNWDYVKLAESFGCKGYLAKTVGELDHAVREAWKLKDKPAIVAVVIPSTDLPAVLRPSPEK